jgi:hypothetical protein
MQKTWNSIAKMPMGIQFSLGARTPPGKGSTSTSGMRPRNIVACIASRIIVGQRETSSRSRACQISSTHQTR